ncbi:MAG TPA: GWxTD domain-containing protein [Candidatus Acidoferrales bacterium]|nr:GWxTD domain-containing protein [Candidatus Acidoferrales bacterium]
MKRLGRWLVMGAASAGLLATLSYAQDAPPKQDDKNAKSGQTTPSPQLTKQQQKKLQKELGTPYKKWLDEEVVYIITPEERQAFLQLQTNEDRENFIEQFWLRRDPTPDTPENEFKEEHYRRIAYANERYASGIPGWRTDRGRIYIIWGKPDSTDSHPAGGPYTRTPEEGGGETSVYPFEDWHYNYLENVGSNIDLEFVDPTGSGEYHLTTDPCEKDALAKVPNAGMSDMEAQGLATQAQRFTNPNGTSCPISQFQTAADDPFERISLFAKVQVAPPVKFHDLSELVTARIVRNQINYNYHFDFLRITSDSIMVPITIEIPNKEMNFKDKDGVHSANMNLFMRISTIGGRVAQTVEETITRDFPDTLFQEYLKRDSIYSKTIPLRPGLYRLDIVLKDVESGNVGVINTRLAVPNFKEDEIDGSQIILADEMEHVPPSQVGLGPFVIGDTKVRPQLKQEFPNDQKMGVYAQVYNLKIDEKTHRNNVTVQYRVLRGDQEVFKRNETADQIKQTGDELTVERLLPLSTFQPGKYKIEITVNDQVGNQTLTRTAEFTIKPAAQERAATN